MSALIKGLIAASFITAVSFVFGRDGVFCTPLRKYLLAASCRPGTTAICLSLLFAQTLFAQGVQRIGTSAEGPIMRVSIDPRAFAQNFRAQQLPEWCWAASIANIYAFYHHPLQQPEIVQAVYGTVVNLPAMSAQMIAAQVNRPWRDDTGRLFQARLTAAYDFQAGVVAINNMYIVNELAHGRPLLVCNTHHCMVITAVDYTPSQVLQVWVFDPWPLSPTIHVLPPQEAIPANLGGQLMFVGAVTVN